MHIRIPREERRAEDEFGEDDAERPDVDGRGVEFRAKEKLGGTVPAGDDVGGHGTLWVGEGAGETEIGEFELAGGAEE